MRHLFKTQASSPGFTLVEVLVSVAIFAASFSAIVGSFLAVLRLHEKSRSIRVVEQNARFVTDFITREFRNGSLDYAAYGSSIPKPTQTLNLLNNDGESVSLSLQNGQVRVTKSGVGTSTLTGSDVTVSNFNFYIEPSTDPFCAGCPEEQPLITFTIRLNSNISARATDQAVLNIQTSISSREYPEI